mgnify:CR=1 FL=1
MYTKAFMFVEPNGIEPMTSWLPVKRSPNWAKAPKREERLLNKTFAKNMGLADDLPDTRVGTLSQLS